MTYNLSSANIECGIYSDHSIISLEFFTADRDVRGRGFWKMKSNLLLDESYIYRTKTCIAECIFKYKSEENKCFVWNSIKAELQGISISYAAYKAKLNKEQECRLVERINCLEGQLGANPTFKLKEEYTTVKRQLEI